MNIKVIKPTFLETKYNILDFGASTLKPNNRLYIQKAIDECSEKGGGMVIIPNGMFLTGPIRLKSNVNLHLENNAYLKFIKKKEEYPLIFTEYEGNRKIRCISPISANNQENIAITGEGTIDGSGELWRGIKKFKLTEKEWKSFLKKSEFVYESGETKIWCPSETYYNGMINGEPKYDDPKALEKASLCWDMYRPVLVDIVKCDKVLLEDATFMNSPAWNLHPNLCTNVTVDNVKVKNKYSAQNSDGIDLESCQNCEIKNSTFEVGDDGICMKSGKNKEARSVKVPTSNVWIHDCKVYNAHGGFVIGSEMSRGVNNVLIEDCTFVGTDVGIRFKSAMGRGGVVEDITIKNISMANIINEAMIFTMGYVFTTVEGAKDNNSKYDIEDIPEFKNINIENVNCYECGTVIDILGLEQKRIHDIKIKDSRFINAGDSKFSLCDNIVFENVLINDKLIEKEVINK